ncbi:hypothetical protein NQ318_002439 [Aromia moschata]|uniref:Uncharacterized protein n=1 Tax=Aromia moschata TaxID=1265417 RepID=A0AAV8YFK3_9CUCU|nr:hypothetical protein NQ318_002439 [Aromia moschata]
MKRFAHTNLGTSSLEHPVHNREVIKYYELLQDTRLFALSYVNNASDILVHLLAQCISDYFGLSQLQCTSVTPAGISASEGKHPRAYRPWEIAAYGRKHSALTDKSLHDNFKCRFAVLSEIKAGFDKQHTNILNIVSTMEDGDLEEEYKVQTEFNSHYFHVQAVFKQLFGDSKDTLDTSSKSVGVKQNVKLPKIGLPQFNGDVSQWQTFIDSFRSLIHENDSLSNIEKFNYLLQCLKGEPFNLTRATPLNSANYLVAYNALVKRYDNPLIIATAHWHAIENTKKLGSSEGPGALRFLVDAFRENVSILKNMKFPVKQWDFILFNMLFDRLDKSTATRFELSHDISSNTEDSFEILLDFLDKQCDAQSKVALSRNFNLKAADLSKSESKPRQYSTSRSVTSTSLTTNTPNVVSAL